MRTDLTAEIGGAAVRGVVSVAALVEMVGDAKWRDWLDALDAGDPRVVRAVLASALRAAGDLRPLEIGPEVARLIEEGGLNAAHAFAVRLVNDALHKAETARKNSPAAAPTAPTTAA